MKHPITIKEVTDAYYSEGGETDFSRIYKYFKQRYKDDELLPNYENEIRALVYSNSKDSRSVSE